MEKTNYVIKVRDIEKLRKHIKKINKLEKKLGYTPSELIEGLEYTKQCIIRDVVKEKDYKVQCNVIDVTIIRDNKIHDLDNLKHTLLAKIEHFINYDNIENDVKIFSEDVFNYYSLEELKNISARCEHCNTNRKRKYTYIVKDNINNKVYQIARSCLKAYTLIDNIEDVANMYDNIVDIEYLSYNENEVYYKDEENIFTYDGNIFYRVLDILTVTQEVIKKYGYISNSKAFYEGKISTSERVREELAHKEIQTDNNLLKEIKEFLSYNKEDYFTDYCKNDNNFIFKLEKLLSYDFVENRNLSVIVSFFNVLNKIRYIKKKREEKENIKEKLNKLDYIEKQKVELNNLKLVNFRTYENNYYNSSTTYYYFEDTNKITFLWKSSKIIKELDEIGKIINLKGTVKEKQDNKILLTRCKII